MAFLVERRLKNHELTHAEVKPFECEVCKKTFTIKYNLERHHKTHFQKEIKSEEVK